MKRKPKGQVYFLQNGKPEEIKIGYTGGPRKKRIKQLQTGSSTELIPCMPSIPAWKRQEKQIHDLLKNFRIRGGGREWFYWNDESKPIVEKFIQDLRMEQISLLPLFEWGDQNDSRYEDYGLLPKWPIEQLTNAPSEYPECNWAILKPDGGRLFERMPETALKTRIFHQYLEKNATEFTLEDHACYSNDDATEDGISKELAEAIRQGKISSRACWIPDNIMP